MEDALQQALGTNYTIERELGGGGMSRVFVAHDKSLDRKVVVKVMAPEIAGPLSAERFKLEIMVSAGLQHPNIIGVISAGEADGVPFFVMPFVEGESLRALLNREPQLPVRQATNILRDVARALAFAHERGVIHRDIKPDNVLLTAGAATLADFGVAKAVDAAKRPEADADPLTSVGTSLGVETEKYHLYEMALDCWGGFVFVRVKSFATTLADQLGDIPERFCRYPLARRQ